MMAGWRQGRLYGCRYQLRDAGMWVVDMQGLRGSVLAREGTFRRRCCNHTRRSANSINDLQDIAHNFADAAPTTSPDQREFAVLISHASEDEDDVVRPLAGVSIESQRLVRRIELRIGVSLRRKIDAGIARKGSGSPCSPLLRSSPKGPQYELGGLVTIGVSDAQALLPLRH